MRLFLCLFLVYLSPNSFGSDDDDYRISVKTVTGKVSFLRPPTNKRRTIRIGTVLRQRDVIYTEEESSLEIVFENGSIVKIQENALLKLTEIAKKISEGRTLMNLTTGNLTFKVNSLTGELASFRFETPTFSAAIRGTEGGLGVTGKNSMAYLREGKLLMEPIGRSSALSIEALDLCVYNGMDLRKRTFKTPAALDSALNVVKTAFATKKNLDKVFEKEKRKPIKKAVKKNQKQLFFPVD